MNYVWIVEMYCDDSSQRWLPTVGAALTRDDGRLKLSHWRERNPGGRFRLRKYTRNQMGVD